ncbi:MAG: TraB/GumN family protein [Verrucomicrobiota bacterium]
MISLRLFLWLPALALLLSCRPTPPAATGKPAPRGSVWVADREGKPGKLFLCGTIHILRESDYPLPAGYGIAYRNSSKLVLELPPGASEAPEFQARLMELGQYPAGETLQASVSPELWKEFEAWTKRRNVSLSRVERFRPWLAALVITSTEYASLGAKVDKGADHHYEAMAKRDGKPGEGLETVEFQLQLFTQLTPAMQEEMLAQTLVEVRDVSQEFEKMISAWKNGELEVLHEMLTREAEKYPDLMNLFLTNRNRAWMDRLDAMLQRGENVMLLVGAGHLGGERDGVLALLRQRGYRVRHVTEAAELTPKQP